MELEGMSQLAEYGIGVAALAILALIVLRWGWQLGQTNSAVMNGLINSLDKNSEIIDRNTRTTQELVTYFKEHSRNQQSALEGLVESVSNLTALQKETLSMVKDIREERRPW